MTEICAVGMTTGRVMSIPGQPWTIESPAEVRRLRSTVLAQLRALDVLLRELALEALRMPPAEVEPGSICRLGDTAYR